MVGTIDSWKQLCQLLVGQLQSRPLRHDLQFRQRNFLCHISPNGPDIVVLETNQVRQANILEQFAENDGQMLLPNNALVIDLAYFFGTSISLSFAATLGST